jgi:hypothetical protein
MKNLDKEYEKIIEANKELGNSMLEIDNKIREAVSILRTVPVWAIVEIREDVYLTWNGMPESIPHGLTYKRGPNSSTEQAIDCSLTEKVEIILALPDLLEAVRKELRKLNNVALAVQEK